MSTPTAVMSVSSTTGAWRLFVALPNTTAPWPEHVFDAPGIPTLAARTAALTVLGYEGVEGAEWQWSEDPTALDGPVHLLTRLDVRERAGGAA